FFQAEDGIRDRNVTGVQTCALPIFGPACLAVLDVDLVQLRSQTDELVVGHPVQLRGGRVLGGLTHERDPIHRVAPMRATMPTSHMATPSVTGPSPPSV